MAKPASDTFTSENATGQGYMEHLIYGERLDIHISIAYCPNGVLRPVWTPPSALISYEQIQHWQIHGTEPRSHRREWAWLGREQSPLCAVSEITQRTSHPSHVTARASSNFLHCNNRLANERVV